MHIGALAGPYLSVRLIPSYTLFPNWMIHIRYIMIGRPLLHLASFHTRSEDVIASGTPFATARPLFLDHLMYIIAWQQRVDTTNQKLLHSLSTGPVQALNFHGV